ncbi:hypothetical protein ABG067_006765 [Albugo candida]
MNIRQDKQKPLCLTQNLHHVEDGCRSCLREKNAFNGLGEFLVVNNEIPFVLFVLRTSHTKVAIIEACTENNACAEFKDIYPDNACQDVHGSGALKDHDSPSTSQRSNSNAPVVETHLRCFSVDISTINEASKSDFWQDDYTINALREVGNTKELYAHLASFSTDVPQKKKITRALILVWFQNDTPKNSFLRRYPHTRRQVDVPHCYEKYGDQFDTSPIRSPISVQTPETINLMSMGELSQCVLAHQEGNECDDCIELAGITGSDLSSTEFLIGIKDEQKLELGKCISTSTFKACNKLEFVPNEICMHEKLLDFVSESTMSRPNHFGELATIVLVKYGDNTCLACLALRNPIIMASRIKSYVWMVKPNRDSPWCACGVNTGLSFKRPMYFLRPLSAARVMLGPSINRNPGQVTQHHLTLNNQDRM